MAIKALYEQYGLLITVCAILLAFLAVTVVYRVLFGSVNRLFGKNHVVATIYQKCYYPGLATVLVLAAITTLRLLPDVPPRLDQVIEKTLTLALIGSITYLLIRIIAVLRIVLLHGFDVHSDNNLQARKVYTQFQILERIVVFLLITLAIAVALMSFDSIRQVGVSLLASAGIVGIILGFAAQKSFSTIFAGIQIAIAQPIRIDDVVVVEGEWGRIEEIMLTYVTIRLWDNRRLVVPVNYFLEKPFQNWTRVSAEITGAVYLYADYQMPLQPLRDELDRILTGNPLWDGKVKALQVTDSTERAMQIRVLVSAENSGKAWDLRCDVREKLVNFMQQHYAQHLPKERWEGERAYLSDGRMQYPGGRVE